LPRPFAKAKNGDEEFWKEKFHVANGKAQHALMKGPVFSFLRARGRGIFSLFPMCSQGVLIKFSNDSQVLKVFPNAFLKMFPIAPGFYIIWFAQISTPMYVN
jgi:hypothetical protein